MLCVCPLWSLGSEDGEGRINKRGVLVTERGVGWGVVEEARGHTGMVTVSTVMVHQKVGPKKIESRVQGSQALCKGLKHCSLSLFVLANVGAKNRDFARGVRRVCVTCFVCGRLLCVGDPLDLQVYVQQMRLYATNACSRNSLACRHH